MPDTKKRDDGYSKEQFDEAWKNNEQSEQATPSDGDQSKHTSWMSDLGNSLSQPCVALVVNVRLVHQAEETMRVLRRPEIVLQEQPVVHEIIQCRDATDSVMHN